MKLALSLCLSLLLAPGLAHAAPPTAPPAAAPTSAPPSAAVIPLSEALTGEARAEYESGKILFRDHDHVGALVKFSSAYDKAHDVRLLWNMAACHKNLRHYARVTALLHRYLDEGGTLLTAEDRSEAETLLKTVEPLTSTLRLTTNVEGADVYVDDEKVGTTPLAKPVLVDIGMRKVRVARDGYSEATKEIPVGGAPEIVLELKLTEIVHRGKVVVRAGKDDSIALDGKVVGVGTYSGTLASGGHTLRVTAPKMRPYQSEIIVSDGQTRDVAVALEAEPSSGVPLWVWIGGGVLLASGAAVGGYFLLKPERSYDGPSGTLPPSGVVELSFR